MPTSPVYLTFSIREWICNFDLAGQHYQTSYLVQQHVRHDAGWGMEQEASKKRGAKRLGKSQARTALALASEGSRSLKEWENALHEASLQMNAVIAKYICVMLDVQVCELCRYWSEIFTEFDF